MVGWLIVELFSEGVLFLGTFYFIILSTWLPARRKAPVP